MIQLFAPLKIRTRVAVLFTAMCSLLISISALATYFSYAQALRMETEELLFSQFFSLSATFDDATYDAFGGVRLGTRAIQHIQAASSIGIVTVLKDTE
jgi:hypothetical protein